MEFKKVPVHNSKQLLNPNHYQSMRNNIKLLEFVNNDPTN